MSTDLKSKSRKLYLPDEILHNILIEIDSRPTWLSLAVCTKQFHRLVTPLIYTSVTLHNDITFEHFKNLMDLLRTNRNHASHVLRFKCDSSTIPCVAFRTSYSELTDLGIFLRNIDISDVTIPIPQRKNMHIAVSTIASLVCLTVAFLPRLRHLSLPSFLSNLCAGIFFKATRCERPFDIWNQPFAELSDLTFDCQDYTDGSGNPVFPFKLEKSQDVIKPDALSPWFTLQSLRRLALFNMHLALSDSSPLLPEIPPGGSSVTHLEILASNAPSLGRMLGVIKHLKSFVFRWNYNYEPIGLSLVDCLSLHADTLENIAIEQPMGVILSDPIRFDSFVGFKSLRYLKTCYNSLFPGGQSYNTDTPATRFIELFPSSLEVLHIHRVTNSTVRSIVPWLDSLLASRDACRCLPLLQSLLLQVDYQMMPYSDSNTVMFHTALSALRTLERKEGVILTVHEHPWRSSLSGRKGFVSELHSWHETTEGSTPWIDDTAGVAFHLSLPKLGS